jgi:RNA polymerase-binding transcription factor DksA
MWMAPGTLKRHPTAIQISPEQRARLEARMEREIERLSRTLYEAPSLGFEGGGGEVDLLSFHPRHELGHAVAARSASQLGEWLRALRLLRNDPLRYATCEICGRGIPWSRLEALAITRRCGRC